MMLTAKDFEATLMLRAEEKEIMEEDEVKVLPDPTQSGNVDTFMKNRLGLPLQAETRGHEGLDRYLRNRVTVCRRDPATYISMNGPLQLALVKFDPFNK